MTYRRSVSITPIPASSSTENPSNHGKSDFCPDLPSNLKSRKRHAPHDEEKEMALFRRVRIKTEIKVLAIEPQNKPSLGSTTHINSDDPYSDPELLRTLEIEAEHENELLLELRTEEQRKLDAEMQFDREAEMVEDERLYEAELEDAYYRLQEELENEAAVDREIHERMMLDELPSDSDEENTEDSESYDSDNSNDVDDEIDMDYRFS
jgi:hypothetical protein